MAELTPKQMVEAGKVFKEYVLPMMSLEERLLNVSTKDLSEEKLNKIPFIYRIKEQGVERGRQEGERKAKIEALNQIIPLRFKVEPGKFDKQFAQLSLNVLTALTETALTAESLADFEKALSEKCLKNQ